MAKQTQCRQLLQYLQDHGSITSKQAYDHLGITQLATRISELEERGFPIDRSRWKDVKNRQGETVQVKVYRLHIPGEQTDLFGSQHNKARYGDPT